MIRDSTDLIITATNVMEEDIENLIVLRAAITLREDIAAGAAGDAILIKDGDTTIDTSKTAAGNENRLKAMKSEFNDAFNIVVINRTQGVGSDGLEIVTGVD